METQAKNQKRGVALALLLAVLLNVAVIPLFAGSNRAEACFRPKGYPTGLPATGTVVDISSHSNPVDFTKLKSKGVQGVMMRAALSTKKDSCFDSYCEGATKAGIPYGVYQYVYWCRQPNFAAAMAKATEEAEYFLQCISGKNIRGYVVLDLEYPTPSKLTLTPKEMTDISNYYLGLIRTAGYKPMFYCGARWLSEQMEADRIEAPLWLAYYAGEGTRAFPQTKYGDVLRSVQKRIVMWQYTDKEPGSNWGMGGYADLNHLYYSFTG